MTEKIFLQNKIARLFLGFKVWCHHPSNSLKILFEQQEPIFTKILGCYAFLTSGRLWVVFQSCVIFHNYLLDVRKLKTRQVNYSRLHQWDSLVFFYRFSPATVRYNGFLWINSVHRNIDCPEDVKDVPDL